jgi:peptidyl-prolyl cis-trans isomerase C
MAPRKNFLSAAGLVAMSLAIGLTLSACGLGRDSSGDGAGINDPVVAATVNGRPIYIEDVRAHAVARGFMGEGEDLDANSDAFFVALEELIQFRLFSMEAEARGLDRAADVRRQLDNARERVLAASIYEEIDTIATDEDAIRRLYEENAGRLGQGSEVHLRHMEFTTRELADAAKRRLDGGERFEALAFELSSDRETAPDGGDLGWTLMTDVAAPIRTAIADTNTGTVVGPVSFENHWYLVRLEDRRERGVPSLEELRPRIVNWLRFQEITRLHERLERDARIERLREQDIALDPGEETPAPADATPQEPVRPAPDAAAPPGQSAPPFPFPVTPSEPAPRPAPAAQAPTPQQPATGGDGATP